MTQAESIFIFGASGHAKVVIDILERQPGVKIAFAIDDAQAAWGSMLCGYPVIGGRDILLSRHGDATACVVTIGANKARCAVADWLDVQGFKRVKVVHPAAMVANRVIIGQGTVVMAGSVINSETTIGENVIINTGASVDHDCLVADGVHVAPGCHLCGGVSVGAGSFIGAGTTVIPGVRIGAGVLIGAGSTVLKDIADGARVAGSPARFLEGAA